MHQYKGSRQAAKAAWHQHGQSNQSFGCAGHCSATHIPKKITTIMFASDLANLDKELETVAAFAAPIQAEVQLLHFTTYLDTQIDPEKMEQATKKSDNLHMKLDIKFFEPAESLVSHIEAAVIRTKPSMLVMFTEHHRNLFEKIFLSSKSAEYSYHPTVPLLVFNKL